MKSIRTQITVCLILTVLVSLVASGSSSIALNYNSTMSTVEQMMTETAVLAAGRAQQELMAYKNAVMEIGCIPELADSDVPLEEKRAIIDDRVAMHGFQRGNIIGMDGISIFDGKDYSDREYVRQALQGNVYVSEPLISKITGELSIMVAAPLYAEETYGKSTGPTRLISPEIRSPISRLKRSRFRMWKRRRKAIRRWRNLRRFTRKCVRGKPASEAIQAEKRKCLRLMRLWRVRTVGALR